MAKRSTRLTQRDVHVILTALNALEAGAFPDEMGMTDEQAADFYDALESATTKISERWNGSTSRWER